VIAKVSEVIYRIYEARDEIKSNQLLAVSSQV